MCRVASGRSFREIAPKICYQPNNPLGSPTFRCLAGKDVMANAPIGALDRGPPFYQPSWPSGDWLSRPRPGHADYIQESSNVTFATSRKLSGSLKCRG